MKMQHVDEFSLEANVLTFLSPTEKDVCRQARLLRYGEEEVSLKCMAHVLDGFLAVDYGRTVGLLDREPMESAGGFSSLHSFA